jgi:hypothetical protein
MHGGGVVIKTGGATFKERRDDHDAELRGPPLQLLGRRPGNGLGQIEEPRVFALAEVLRAKELRQANDVRAQRARPHGRGRLLYQDWRLCPVSRTSG